MIVVMKPGASKQEIDHVIDLIHGLGLRSHVIVGTDRTVVAALGEKRDGAKQALETGEGVEKVVPILAPYKMASTEVKKEPTCVQTSQLRVGAGQIGVIAGPCSVESREQILETAQRVKESGATGLRGGAFKPRTSPYTFQGKGVEGLKLLKEAAKSCKLPVVTELMDARMLDSFLEHGVDVIQIGTRNMQNFDLLKAVGQVSTPVILKRGMSATISEWLMAGEYIAAGGNHNIIFCERGIRTFESAYRNVLDVTAIPVMKRETHLPVIVDPSHAGGKAWMVPALSRAAVAAGADGLLIEIHPTPKEAWCDADQALTPAEFAALMNDLAVLAKAMGRDF